MALFLEILPKINNPDRSAAIAGEFFQPGPTGSETGGEVKVETPACQVIGYSERSGCLHLAGYGLDPEIGGHIPVAEQVEYLG